MPLVLTFFMLSATLIIIVLSTIKLEIGDLELSNIVNRENSKFFRYNKIKLSFCLFGKIKFFSFKLNKDIIKKIYSKMNLKKFNIGKGIKLLKNKKNVNMLKKLNIKLDSLDLELNLGLEDVILTTELIAAISIGLSNVLPHIISNYVSNKYKYKIMPLYINKNVYYIKLNCIFQVKIVHIINIIYIYLKKGKSDNNE